MKALEEQRVCIKFCLKLRKTFTETFQVLQQAYGEDCLSRTQCHEWYQRFKSDRTSIEDDPKSERSSTTITLRKCLRVSRTLYSLSHQVEQTHNERCPSSQIKTINIAFTFKRLWLAFFGRGDNFHIHCDDCTFVSTS